MDELNEIESFEPFGEQWQKEMQELPKSVIIEMFAESGKEKIRLNTAISRIAMLNPNISFDGNQWCALHGENLQEGIAGFGDTPADAIFDFVNNWYENPQEKIKGYHSPSLIKVDELKEIVENLNSKEISWSLAIEEVSNISRQRINQ